MPIVGCPLLWLRRVGRGQCGHLVEGQQGPTLPFRGRSWTPAGTRTSRSCASRSPAIAPSELPVEVLTRHEIETRLGPDHLGRPELVEFHLLIFSLERGGHHVVDFQPVPVASDGVLVVRPGQVVAWDADHRSEAIAVLARPWVVDRTWLPGDPTTGRLDHDDQVVALDLIGILRREQDRYDGSPHADRIMTSIYTALDLLAERALGAPPTVTRDEPAVAFRRTIEERIASGTIVHNVADLTAQLPWSNRTVARAVARATGLTPKQVLDQRLLLEAQRHLAHTDDSIKTIAANLGFADRTNFHRFFERVGGEGPSGFRHRSAIDLRRTRTSTTPMPSTNTSTTNRISSALMAMPRTWPTRASDRLSGGRRPASMAESSRLPMTQANGARSGNTSAPSRPSTKTTVAWLCSGYGRRTTTASRHA